MKERCYCKRILSKFDASLTSGLRTIIAHQNRTIAIASDFRVDCAKSAEIAQKEGVLGSEIAARNRKSLATFHRNLKSQCSIAFSCLGNRPISGVRYGHRNRKSQKSLRFRCAKILQLQEHPRLEDDSAIARAPPLRTPSLANLISRCIPVTRNDYDNASLRVMTLNF